MASRASSVLPETGARNTANASQPNSTSTARPTPQDGLITEVTRHDVTTTASRRLRRADDFRAAATFMLEQGFHPRADRKSVV